jgi:hypothetical protein
VYYGVTTTFLQAVGKYDSVDKVPINRRLIQFYQSAHSKYAEELAAGQTEKHDSEAQQAEKSEMQLREKRNRKQFRNRNRLKL